MKPCVTFQKEHGDGREVCHIKTPSDRTPEGREQVARPIGLPQGIPANGTRAHVVGRRIQARCACYLHCIR